MFKKNMQKTNVCIMASQRMVGLVHARIWEKKKRKEIEQFLIEQKSHNFKMSGGVGGKWQKVGNNWWSVIKDVGR